MQPRTGSPMGSNDTTSPDKLLPAKRERGANDEIGEAVTGAAVRCGSCRPALCERAAFTAGGALSTMSRSIMLPENAADEDGNAGAGIDVTEMSELAMVAGGSGLDTFVDDDDGEEEEATVTGTGGSFRTAEIGFGFCSRCAASLSRISCAFPSNDASVGHSSNACSNTSAASLYLFMDASAHALR
ncbi:hypothetical protein FI667_g4218, partial [Globisporangium splendens]